MTIQCTKFLKSLQLQDSIDEKTFIINLESILHNGLYEFTKPETVLQNLFNVKSLKEAEERLLKSENIHDKLSTDILLIVQESIQVDDEFLKRIDEAIYPYI